MLLVEEILNNADIGKSQGVTLRCLISPTSRRLKLYSRKN